MKVLDSLRADGKPLLVQGYHNGIVYISGDPSRVGVVDCSNLRIEGEDGEISVSGQGDYRPAHDARNALVIAHRSNELSFGPMRLHGLPDDSTKESWIKTVPNGFEAHHTCRNVETDYIYGRYLHNGIQGRCEWFSHKAGELEFISGDFIRATADNFYFGHTIGRYSLAVLAYVLFHRDAGQFWQENKAKEVTHREPGQDPRILRRLLNGTVEHCKFWTPDTGHKWAESCDGFLFSEQLYEGMKFFHNHIYTNNANAARGGVMKDCEFIGNVARRSDEVIL